MARQVDEATRRARIRARQWLRKRQEIDSGPHTRCACQHCVNILAEHDRQTEARVRREDRKVIEAMLVSPAWAGEPALVDALKELDKLTTPPPHDDRTEPVMARQEQRFEED